ncbi:MAG: hypothetical protein IT249_07100 [Chitinophagaceae bacterium]|nr:hypothetical protein [Chitinophagaceae bacterium]
MTYDFNTNIDLIEKYIDGSVNDEEKTIVEELLNNNADLQEEYEYMRMAVESVKIAALHKQVGNIAEAYKEGKNNTTVTNSKPAKVRSMGFYAMRAAAAIVVVSASYIAIQYATITPDKLYASAFEDYNPSITRGVSKGTDIEQLYKMGNWDGVLSAVSNESLPKEKFLAGVSALQLNKADVAADYFNQVIETNKTLSEKPYTQESEFYLALALIRLQNYDAAKKLVNTIKANPEHAYYNQAKKISTFKTTLLSFKK